MINLNSPIGYVFFNNNNKASAALPPSNTNLINQVNENELEVKDKIYNPQLDANLEVAQIPRVRQQNPKPSDVPLSEPNNNSPQAFPPVLNQDNINPFFTPSFKQISDDTAELTFIDTEGCQFVTTIKKTKNLVYQESIKFIPSSIQACGLGPFTAILSPDGQKIQVKVENSPENLIAEQINSDFINLSYKDSQGKTVADKFTVPEELKKIREEQANINLNSMIVLQIEGEIKDDNPKLSDGKLYQEHFFKGIKGQSITISLESDDFDPYLLFYQQNNNIKFVENDNIDQNNTNSIINITLPNDGDYRVVVTSRESNAKGKYILTIQNNVSTNFPPVTPIPQPSIPLPQSKPQPTTNPPIALPNPPSNSLPKPKPQPTTNPPIASPNPPSRPSQKPSPSSHPSTQPSTQLPNTPSSSDPSSPRTNPSLKIPPTSSFAKVLGCKLVKGLNTICNAQEALSTALFAAELTYPEKYKQIIKKIPKKFLLSLNVTGLILELTCLGLYGGLPTILSYAKSYEEIRVLQYQLKNFNRYVKLLDEIPSILETPVRFEKISAIFSENFRKYLFDDELRGVASDFLDKCEGNPRSGKQVQGTSYGDPHLITFDGHRYSFQTIGEFILAKSTDGDFEVQTRQTPVNKSLSLNSAVAMKVGRNRVAFYSQNFPDSDTSTPLRINGQPTVIQGNLSIPGGGKIYKQDESNYVVEWPTGEKVTVTIYSRGQFKYMDVFPFVFESQANQMVGLLGNVNSDVNDDLRFRSGQLLPTKSTYGDLKQLLQGISPVRLPLAQLEKIYLDQLNKDFGNSWRVSQAESLFDYPPEKSTANFTDKAFPDAYLTLDMLSPTQLQNARSQCLQAGVDASLLEGCIFDVGFTGFSEFAYHTAKVSNILDIVESVIPGFKNPIPDLLRQIPKIPGLNF